MDEKQVIMYIINGNLKFHNLANRFKYSYNFCHRLLIEECNTITPSYEDFIDDFKNSEYLTILALRNKNNISHIGKSLRDNSRVALESIKQCCNISNYSERILNMVIHLPKEIGIKNLQNDIMICVMRMIMHDIRFSYKHTV